MKNKMIFDRQMMLKIRETEIPKNHSGFFTHHSGIFERGQASASALLVLECDDSNRADVQWC